ncbi:MAG: glycosyltransferase family 2 protein [Gammaproteobacteria bacterium]|jgi:glycosyltransferase involved in cell wall biosynthesis|nr:glycosyl transferase [Chromatiales bacterium]MDP6675706.1 glycosyltransferase family 2 protein [Gammaproteobacteria bacterium]
MKLIVQIPCFNEEATLPATLADIPRNIEGIDCVEILIIDDGSTDRTVEIANQCGADYIIHHKRNKGLAITFRTGIDACLRLGADIIVNTDGDNQYSGFDIPQLCAPILEGRAEIVIGDRQTDRIEHFSPLKKILQRLGSSIVRRLSTTEVPDVVSGFRAISREAAIQLNIVSPFSYTIEMVIQAGKRHMAIASVPVATNPVMRKSRLYRSVTQFIREQVTTIVRMYAMYQPLKVFFLIGCALFLIGAYPILRFLWFYFSGQGDGHIQSLIIGSALIMMGFMTFTIGLVADLIHFNRQLLEMTLERLKTQEFSHNDDDLNSDPD